MLRLSKGRATVTIVIAIILVIALIGASLVVVHASSAGLALFELITFSVGVAALLLALLGSVNGTYQMRVMRRISREMHMAITELRDLDKTNESIRRRLNQDYELAKDIAEALREADIIEDDEARHTIARDIEHKVRARVSRDV